VCNFFNLGEKAQEYLAYSEFSQRRPVECIGAKNVKLILREPLVAGAHENKDNGYLGKNKYRYKKNDSDLK